MSICTQKTIGVNHTRVPFKWCKVTYRIYYVDGTSKYLQWFFGVPETEENPVGYLKEKLQREWKETLKSTRELNEITYDEQTGWKMTDWVKIISIDGVKVNLEIH